MNISEHFIRRPAGTTLLMVAIALAGAVGYLLLPVAPLPEVEFPTISVSAGLPGASPETMASAVATPLERMFGRIAGITEMTSTSYLGTTSITIQFDLNRNIDAAARDVQAAINAARGQLPAGLPNNPSYRKVNPADAPILMLALTSTLTDKAHMYDAASSILMQKISQVPGVGQVVVGGGALPAVRVEVNPPLLNTFGLSFEDLRATLGTANVDEPKGALNGPTQSWPIAANDQLLHAADYAPLVIRTKAGAALHLSEVAQVIDSVEDVRTGGLANGKPAVLVLIFRQPGANIIATVDRIRELLPALQASIPSSIALAVMQDRTTTIRASVRDVEITMGISILLFVCRAGVPPVPREGPLDADSRGRRTDLAHRHLRRDVSPQLHARQPVAHGAHDRHRVRRGRRHRGHREHHAAHRNGHDADLRYFRGAREIGFTVVSISTLIAVFIPILLDRQVQHRRLFREFAVTLAVAIGVSMVISADDYADDVRSSCCASKHPGTPGPDVPTPAEKFFDAMLWFYEATRAQAIRSQVRHPDGHVFDDRPDGLSLCASLTSKGFFVRPQDTGRLSGSDSVGPRAARSQSMRILLQQYTDGVKKDPGVDNVMAFTGGGGKTTNTANMFISLKPLEQRKLSADLIIGRPYPGPRPKGARKILLQTQPDIRVGESLQPPPSTNTRFKATASRNWPCGARSAGEAQVGSWTRGLEQRPAERGPASLADRFDRVTAPCFSASRRRPSTTTLYDAFGRAAPSPRSTPS